jgi:hypothetical protein
MLTIKSVEKLSLNSVEWDEGKGSVSGFGIRRRTGKTVVYVLKYRTLDGRQRWHTIGRHGAPWTPDIARNEALRLLGEVVKGDDPAGHKQKRRRAATVTDLCDAYLEAAKAGRILTRGLEAKKASTLATDEGRIKRHIKPLLGRLKVASVTDHDIERFRDDVAEGATQRGGVREDLRRADVRRSDRSPRPSRSADLRPQRRYADCVEARPPGAIHEAAH